VTVRAPSNIAFVKYWGARDLQQALPRNASISMTLSECYTRSTATLVPEPGPDEILLATEGGDLRPAPEAFAVPVHRHLERLRRHAGRVEALRIATRNNFPSDCGLASSASGFAALTLAAMRALGLDPSPAELSLWSRRSGSGSAARSAHGGYVELPAGSAEPETYAHPLAAADHWELCDLIAIVQLDPKGVSSRDGHLRAPTSPYFERRLELLPARLGAVRRAIADRNLGALGPVLEAEAIDLHLITMSSEPPIFYWRPGTLEVLDAVRNLRTEGSPAFATMDAGANVHVICEPREEEAVAERLAGLAVVQRVIRDRTGAGPRVEEVSLS